MICPEGCHLCCLETEMILTESDVKRLESLGYDRKEFSEFRDGFLRIKNIDGKCYFLKDGKCSIYEHRPLGCRAYPVIYDLDKGECVLDEYCPAIHTIDEQEFKEKCDLAIKVVRELGII